MGNPFLDQEIQRVLLVELENRGFEQSPASEADFLVAESASGNSMTWYSFEGAVRNVPYADYFQVWSGVGGIATVHTFQDGTLVIDLIDPKTGKLIWHGWSTEPVNSYASDKKTIQGFVKEVLNRFPPE